MSQPERSVHQVVARAHLEDLVDAPHATEQAQPDRLTQTSKLARSGKDAGSTFGGSVAVKLLGSRHLALWHPGSSSKDVIAKEHFPGPKRREERP